MKRSLTCLLVLAAVLANLGCAGGGQVGSEPRSGTTIQPARTAPDRSPAVDLRQGGYVIYFRHAATEAGGADGPENLGNRDAQRNLSEEVRAQAEAIEEAFRKLDVPVGEVLSSPYYRSLDTARIAFDRTEPTGELLGIRSDRSFQREQRETALLNLLSTPPRDGTNTILVSHALNAEEFAGITLDEGEAAVLEPLGGDFRFIVRVAPEEWNQLSGSARDTPGEVGARG